MKLLVLGAALAVLVALSGSRGASAQAPTHTPSPRVSVLNTRRAISGRIWGSGSWVGFCIEEDDKDLNGDGDTDDAILCLLDTRSLDVQVTNIALDRALIDDTDDWPIAVSGNLVAIQVSESENGNRDLDGNGSATDNVLHIWDTATRQLTNLGVVGRNPTWLGGRLYFVQPESVRRRDLNGDGDITDQVLCVWDPATRQVRSLGMEAAAGFRVAGDWIATKTSEAAQGGKDLNGDHDAQDTVVQLYHVPEKKWIDTGLACSPDNDTPVVALTPRLCAVGVDEKSQGGKDLNGNGVAQDTVCEVYDLTSGQITNTGQDCSGGLAADGGLVAFATSEKAQAKDLNGNGSADDTVAQIWRKETGKVTNLAHDASAGLVAGGGKVAFVCSEAAQSNRDLNHDGDTDDFALMVYDPVKNDVLNTGYAVDGDLYTDGEILAWRVLESDQGNKDLNGDGDADDSVLFVMDLATRGLSNTRTAATESIAVTGRAVAFGCLESDQGDKDLNDNGSTDDEVLQLARVAR